MSQQNFPRREKLDEHLHVVIATDDKRRIYEAAAARRLTVSEFVRAAIVRAASDPQAA